MNGTKTLKLSNFNACVKDFPGSPVVKTPRSGNLGENGYVDMYGWVPSLFTWNCRNMVNQLYINTKGKFKKKKKKRLHAPGS